MSPVAQHPDTLTVINGPEDGTEFSLTHRSFAIGAEGNCAVSIRLDQLVREVHARAEVVSEGYRLRSANGARLYVNGRPVGAIRSRVAKHGDVLRVGGTDLVLTCGGEGLAGRSRGLRRQSDWFWALRQSIGFVTGACNSGIGYIGRTLGFARRHWLLAAAVVFLIAYATLPGVREWGNALLARARGIGIF